MKFRNLFFAAVAGSAIAAPLAKEQTKRASVFQCWSLLFFLFLNKV
jgi:hypothetical protein